MSGYMILGLSPGATNHVCQTFSMDTDEQILALIEGQRSAGLLSDADADTLTARFEDLLLTEEASE